MLALNFENLINSICLVLPFLEMPRRLIQTKTSFKFFKKVTLLKRNNSRTFKSRSCVNLVFQFVCHWYNLLRQMFFRLLLNTKALLFMKVYHYTEGFFIQPPCCCTLWKKCQEQPLEVFYKKVLLKNFQTTLLKSHFDMSVLL